MSGLGFAAVGIGAACGAWLRWVLGLWFNQVGVALPLGTWAANLLGGYLIGVAVAVFASYPQLSPLWKLLLITGFLGGLTTFSTFSAESFQHLLQGDIGAALLHAAAHLCGSLVMTGLGWWTWQNFSR